MTILSMLVRFAFIWLVGGLVTILIYCFAREGIVMKPFCDKYDEEDFEKASDKYFEIRDEVLKGNTVWQAISSANDELKESNPLLHAVSFVLGLCVWPNRAMVCKEVYDYIEDEVMSRV